MKQFLRFFFFLFLSVAVITVQAQVSGSSINIDQLSDAQLMQYLGMANGSGMSEADLIAKAKEKGLSDAQIQQLRQRLQTMQGNNGSSANKGSDTANFRNGIKLNLPYNQAQMVNGLPVFGSELFSKENLTFEPNLQIPTPRNYQLGVGDQLNIDLFGYSDVSFKLKVTPEGVIRIPSLGPVKVAGLSFEDAQTKIKGQLAKIYPQIQTGKTSVQVSLGQIRSVRVTLIGEVERPGTYTLSSLSNMANALYASGGPNKIGSFRDIELIRNGKIISVFDLYDFLLNGDLSKNLRLEDDDIIKVSAYTTRVAITGAIKRKAIYETRAHENLNDLIKVAGGFSDIAFKDFVRVVRYGKNQKEAITVNNNQYAKFVLQSGDSCHIDSISNLYSNRVVISGAVFHPGIYSVENFPGLKELIQTAGLREDAYIQRGWISRRNDHYVPVILDFNVKDIVAGNQSIALQREDSVRIYSVLDIRAKDSVSINGEVNKPGFYGYADSLQLQDLILMAGGLKEGASGKKIEVSRRIRGNGNEGEIPQYAVVANVELNKDLSASSAAPKFVLQPFDIVSVRRNPAYKEQKTVTLDGEVLYPGKYVLSSNKETLTEIIQQAGGLKSSAYAAGAILIRNTYADSIDYALADEKMQNVKNQVNGIDSLSKILVNSLNRGKKIVGIHLEKALQTPNGMDDIPLMDSDIIRIPRKSETVQTFGSVYVPKKVVYQDGLSFKDVIAESGGFLTYASKKKAYVMYPNGEVRITKHFLFFKRYPKLVPGAEIYVPQRERKPFGLSDIGGIAGIITGVATTILVIKNL